MTAGVLTRHPGLSVRELIARLDKEFGWKINKHTVTGKLYTHRDLFVHVLCQSARHLVVEVERRERNSADDYTRQQLLPNFRS